MSVGSVIQGIENNISKDVKGVETGFTKILPFVIIGFILLVFMGKK